ncbi:hypothetical protein [Pseudanabaena sp. PCC 6802]|uniref:hypothetical protein n=1 Tax=Pseudanabaena sp. PCC 6802 TaxID=118173 RepID=UPI00034DE7DC|nr:hypothetical protein [Pseudanabaena sp. PCC 6802]
MPFELDHLFICTNIGAPAADRLVSFGLTEGTSNIHAGQGTANRRFFFHNCMLELLWVHSSEEAQSEVTRPMYLWERWRDRDRTACPFGVCFHPTPHSTDPLPFPTWTYRPAYLPPPLSISVATNATVLTEPMLFYLAFRKRQDAYPEEQQELLRHAVAFWEITRVTLASPHADCLSPELQSAIASNLIQLRQGETYLMELGFDGEMQGRQADFRPELPLILYW